VLIILVPELEALLAETDRIPGLIGRILARGRCRQLAGQSWQSDLLTGQALPAAPLSRWFDCPDDAAGIWMRADPIHLRPDLNAVWLSPGGHLEASAAVLNHLQSLFAEEGLHLDLPLPQRGYLRLDRLPDCRFSAPWELSGQSLDQVLPAGPDARRWIRLMSECQVLLHQARTDQDQSLPGGLWLWGAGTLPERTGVTARVGTLRSDDPVLRGLARWLGLVSDSSSTDQLPGDDGLCEWKVSHEQSAADNLERLEAWLLPAWRRLRRGRLDGLELGGRCSVWSLGTVDAWRFWQRPQMAGTTR
jgi:hypothetical protein